MWSTNGYSVYLECVPLANIEDSSDLPLGLQSPDDVLVLPSDLAGQATEMAIGASGFEAENSHGAGHYETLPLVIWWRAAFEKLYPPQSGLPSFDLVGDHT